MERVTGGVAGVGCRSFLQIPVRLSIWGHQLAGVRVRGEAETRR